MSMSFSFKPLENETYEQYLLRLGSEKEKMGLSWTQIASKMNEFLSEDFTESKYRKEYHLLSRGLEMGMIATTDNEHLQELESKTVELQKQKYQFQDQKRELNAKIRMIAKYEHLKNEVLSSIKSLEKVKPLDYSIPRRKTAGVRANVLFSDFHYGQESDNSVNKYNPEIFDRRFSHLVSQVLYYCEKHDVEELTIGNIGDFVNGLIHVSTRVESSEDVISQLQYISERLSEAIALIASSVPHVRVINVIGNHARLSPNKNESLLRENLENIIPWYMESRLRGISNIEILRDRDGMFIDNTFAQPHVYVHGDLDHVSNAARSLPQMLGIVPAYIYMGHIHHDTVKDYGRTVVISNGSLCGADEYAVSKRMFAEAMQKMHIFHENGKIEYKIDIPLQHII